MAPMRRLLAAALALLTAWPPAAWAGLRSAPLVRTGKALPGVSVSLALPGSISSVPGLPGVDVSLGGALQLPAAAVQVPGASASPLPSAPLPPAAAPGLFERLAQPMGQWAAPQAQGGKQEAAADFERRVYGASSPDDGSAGVPSGAGSGSASDGSGGAGRLQPPGRGGRRLFAPVLVFVKARDGDHASSLAGLIEEYEFRPDYGFAPARSKEGDVVYRGLLPLDQVDALKRDPRVGAVKPSAGGIEGFSFEPYRKPETRENLFRAVMRGVSEKSDGWSLLFLAPFQVGAMLVLAPLLAYFWVPAGLAYFAPLVLAAAVANLVQVSPLQVLFQRLPPALRFSIAPALQAAAGLALAAQGLPLFGLWAAGNAVLGGLAAVRVFANVKKARSGHELERRITSTELAALVSGLSAALTALAAASFGGSWALGLSLFATLTLLLLALPGPKPAAPAAELKPAAAPQASADLERAAAYGEALENLKKAEKRRGRSVYSAAAAMVLAPLSQAGFMKLYGWGLISLTGLGLASYALVALCLALIVYGAVAMVRVSKARRALWTAATAVTRAAGARTPEAAAEALKTAELTAQGLKALGRARTENAALLAALRRDAALLSDEELGALERLEKAFAEPAQWAGQGRLGTTIDVNRFKLIQVRRRLIWDDASLSAQAAAQEDLALDAALRGLAKGGAFTYTAQDELDLLAGRLDRLYEAPGPLDERRLALALSAAEAFKWGEFSRGRIQAGKNMMALQVMLRRQGRNPGTDPATRHKQAQALLEHVIAAFQTDGPAGY